MPQVIDLIHARVVDTLKRASSTPETIRGDTNIVADLGLDSLAVIDVILTLEERFSVALPLATLVDVVTVDELADLLRASLHQRRQAPDQPRNDSFF